jgi:hypothetical protein
MITPLEYDENAILATLPPDVEDLEAKPETEQALFALQKTYLETHDLNVWKKMFKMCYDYARSLVLKRLKGKIFIEPDEVTDNATAATVAFMRQYQVKHDWKVCVSFAGMIKWKVIESMYRDQSEDQHVSLNSVSERSDRGEELQASIQKIGYKSLVGSYAPKPEDGLDQLSIQDVVNEVLTELDELEMDDRIDILVRLKLVLVMKKPKNRHVKVNFENRWEQDRRVFNTVERTEKEIRSRAFNTFFN